MKQILYDKFNGLNNVGAQKDDELRELVNMLFMGGGIETRPGSWAAIAAYHSSNIKQILPVTVAGQENTFVVTETGVYWDDVNSQTRVLLFATSDSRDVGIFQRQSTVYIGTGAKLYEIGVLDYATPTGTVNLKVNDTVKSNFSYYRSKLVRSSVNLATETFTNTTNWEEITNILGTDHPLVAREVIAFDAGKKEKVKLVIGYNASAAANVTITLNGVSGTVAIAAGDTATAVAGKIRAVARTGWTITGSGSTIYYESTSTGPMDDAIHEYDAGTTQAYGTMSVPQQGKTNDNILTSKVVKCNRFLMHPLSRKIFATGNPEAPTEVYYSGVITFPDDPTYWSNVSTLVPTTPEAKAVGMILLSDSLLIGFTSNWYAWSGVDASTDATWKMLNLPIGPVGPWAMAPVPNGFAFMAKTGLYNVSAAILNTEILLMQNQEVITNLTDQRINASKLLANERISLTYHEERLYLTQVDLVSYYPPGTEPPEDIEYPYVYDFNYGGFTRFAGPSFRCFAVGESRLYFGGYERQLKYFSTSTTTDNSGTSIISPGTASPIISSFRTKDYDMGNNLSSKYLPDLYLLLKQFESASDYTADIILLGDYVKDENEGLSLAYSQVGMSESLIWGRTWGKLWGFSEMMEMECHPHVRSRVFSLKMTASNPLGFYGVGFGYNELRAQGREITTGRELVE